MRPPWAWVMSLLAGAVLAACAGRDTDGITEPLRLDRISFAVERGVNGNRPVRVDLVRVAREAQAADLADMAPGDWFGGDAEAFISAQPEAVVDRWELVPGRPAGPFEVRADGDYAGVLFCDAGGASPAQRLGRGGHVTVTVGADGCAVAGGKRRESLLDRARRSKLARLKFAMPAASNDRRPMRLELVRVKSTELVAGLVRHDSDGWFGPAGRAFREDNPDALYDAWELVPGGTYGPFRLAVNRKVAGVLFCETAGAPALELRWDGDVEVDVDRDGCRLATPRTTAPRTPASRTPASRTGEWRWNPLTWGGWR